MKYVSTFLFSLLVSIVLYGQKVNPTDTIKPGKGTPEKQIKEIKEEKVKELSDTTGNEPKKSPLIDTTVQNKYGDLLNDDTTYNKRYPIWIPAIEVVGINAFILYMDRNVFKYDFATSVSVDTWKRNLKTGWEFDNDRFGINFAGHPYTGSTYFSAARANGYGYFGSFPFAIEGSLIWEYFGENTLPSYNDLVNTTVNGAFLGEVLYRLSSNILDDRTRGFERVSREILAGIVNPMRGINRVLQGKSFRRTNKEVYQKEPLNLTFNAGVDIIAEDVNDPTKSMTSELLSLQLDYGNPFEKRARKPFDLFRLFAEFNFSADRKILDNVLGYGVLFGKNVTIGKLDMLIGGFQYYDYWDNMTFELMSIGVGGGIISKIPISETSNVYINFHVAGIPLGANNAVSGPDTSQVRDYTYNYGWEGKIESTINIGKYITASMLYQYYVMTAIDNVVKKDYTTTVDVPGNSVVNILKPNIAMHITKNLSIGFEHYIYYNDRYLQNEPTFNSTMTEDKIFIQLYLEDKQRRGRYK